MVDCEYNTDNYKSSKISTEAVIKNSKILNSFLITSKLNRCVTMQLESYLS